ncbi:hypothetical protein NQL31_000824 [Lotmaria passim]
MVPRMRVPVREGDDDDEGPAAPDVKGESPDLYSTSPFRGASPSIVSMGRAGSVTSEVMPQAPDIQHLEGELWYVTGKSIPGKKKHATAQWVVCEDNHLSVYSSWAQSSRQLEEKQFERVRILFDFLHPHKHADTVGGSVPQTRRLTLQRNQPRTTAESRVIFDMRDPLRGKSLAGYYYFGIECIIRDAATGKLRRFLEIFCTDRADDHRKWISFWEEMQLRYPMVRNRDANATSMELSSEWLENFVFPHASAKSPPQSSSEVNSSHMLSFIDDDHFSATRAPRSGAAPPNASCTPINSPTSVLSQLKAGLSSGEGRSSLARLPESASALHGGAAVRRNLFSVTEAAEQSRDVLLLSLAETERAMRESVECAEMALRGMLMAHCTLRSLAVRTLHEAELPQTTFLENVVVRSDGGDSSKQSKVDKAGDRPSADRDIIDELQAELKALCGALEQKQALPEVTTVDATPAKADHDGSTATNDVWKSPDAAVVSAATLADYERQLAEVRDENARLREEFKGLAGAAVERVEAAFAMWTETGLSESPAAEAETAPAREQHALNQLYLSADDTLVRALVDVAVDREGTTATSANTSKTEYFENSVAHHTSPPSTAPPFNSSGLSPLNAEFETEAISNLEIEEQKAEGGDCADHRANDAPHAPPLLHGIVRNLQHLETSRVPCGADRPSLPLLIRQQLRHFSLEHVRRLGTTAPRACSTTNLITTSGATPLTASATDAPSTASVEGGTAAALVDPFLQQVVESCIDVFSSLISPSVGATPSSISPVTPAAAEGCGAEDTKEPAVVSTWLVALRECLHRHRERTSLSASDAAAVAGGPTSASKHHDSEGAAAAICVDASAPAAASGGTPHSSFSTQHLPSPRPSSSVEYAAVEESSAIVAEIRHQGREVVQWIQSIQRDERNLKIYVNAVASFTAANAAFQAKQHGTQEPPTTIGVSAPATQTEEKENGRDDVSHATDSKSESDKQLERNTAIAPLAALEKTHHLLARVQNAAQNMKDERTDADSLRRAFLEVSYGPLGLTAANAWLVTRQDEIEGAQIQPGRSTSHIKGASSMQHDRARDGWRAALNTDAVRDRAMSLIGHISLVAALDRLLLTLGRSPTAALQNPWRESGVAPSDTPAESILGLCEQQQQRMKEEEKLSTQLLGRLTEVSALVRWNEAEKGIPAALRAATAVVRAAEERQDLAAKDSNATWLDYEKHKALLAQSYAISAAHETQPNRDSGHPPQPAEEQTENTGATLPHYFDKLEVTQLQLREAQQSRVHAIKKALELTAAALHKGTSEDTPRIPTYKDTDLRAVARALGVAEDAYGGSGEGDERAPTVEQLVARAEELATAAARADKAVTDAEALRAAVEGALGPLPGDDGDALLAAKRAELEAAEAELAAAKGKKARDAAQARVAGLRGEVGSLEASEAERAASGAADYAAAVGERLRDLVQHDERVDNSDKTEPQVTTQHAHVLDGDEWGAVVRDRPAAARDALAGDVSAACHVGAADVSDVAFGPDGRHASFGVTHNAGVSEEELNRRLEAYGFPRMHALYERRGAAPDGADAALAELATATAEHAEELRAVARALGVAEDAYGGSGEGDERGCSVEVLVGAAVGLRKLVSMFGAEYEEACSLLKRLDVAVECAVVHVEHRETGWFDASGAGRWVVAQHCVDSLSAALLTSRAELCELRDSVKTYVDQLEDVKLDEAKLQETVAAAVEKLRAGLGDGELSVPDCVSPLSSRGSAVCGSLFCSLRDLVSEVSEVSLALRKVKTALEEPTTELKSHPVAAKLSFPLAAEGAEVNEGRVVTYQDVVAGVGARVESLRKERLGRLRSEQALRGIAEEVAARTASTDGQWSYGVRRGLSTASPRSLQPKMKPPGAEETGSAGEGSTSRLRPSLSKEAEGDASMSETEDCAQKVLAAFAQMDDVARAMRAAMLTSYEALGGEKKLAEASDQHAAMLLTELATVTGESIEAMRALLSPGEGDSSKRISLSALLESITAKLRADPSSLPVNVTAAVEVAAQASAFREMASCSLPSTGNSSLVRHVARKRKPDPPECARTETFVLKKLLHSRDGSPYASTPFTLQVPLPPSPQGRPITAADFEKQYVYKLEEVDALRRGCAFALGLLDPCGASQDDLGSSELILQLVQRCTSVQHAMEAVHPLFDEAAMMEEVRNAFAANKNLNVDAREEVFPTQCVVLVRVVRALKNAYEEMRASRANAMKQQKFLIDNEQQNTRELREALAEVEDELQQSEQRQAEMQLAAQTAMERASSLETALEVAAQEKACLQETQNDAERALAELQNQNVGLAEQLAMAKERAAAQSESLALLEGIVGEAVDIVQGDVTEAQDALHWRVLGKHAAPLPSQRGCAAHEMLLPALRSIVDGLRECAAGLESVAVDGKAVRAVVAEQQAATRQLRRADDDAHADELDRLERTLRSQDVTAAEETAAHQRLLRQVQNAAAEELASMQQRLERVMRAQKEEETARLDAEGVSRGLRTALSDAEAAQARLQRHAAEVEAQEAEESRKARVALTSVEEQLRMARGELADVCAALATAPSAPPAVPSLSAGGEQTTSWSAAEMLTHHLAYARELRSFVETRQASERQRRARSVQSDDVVAQTLAAFQSLWATAVEAKATPANVKDEWLTPKDKAEVLQGLLLRDFTPQLSDLAAARRLLLNYVSRPTVRRFVRVAVAAGASASTSVTSVALPPPLDSAPTALLVQLYHSALHDAHDARTAELEKEVRESRCDLEAAQQQLREVEEQHELDVAEVELRIGHMREMVQSKLMADEVTEQKTRETEAAMEAHLTQLHAFAAERADMMRHVQELRRLIRKKLRGKSR